MFNVVIIGFPSYDELVVGAPMYTSTDDLDFLVERGRVFIFFNDGVCVCICVPVYMNVLSWPLTLQT